jgi:diamine N-acetyltransferase
MFMISHVHLRPITEENWEACAQLRVAPDQAHYLPSNLHSIALSRFYPDSHLAGIHSGRGDLVGFLMYGRDVQSGKQKIYRLMIDHRHQGRGYGSAALRRLLEDLRAHTDHEEVLISYKVDNERAHALYERLGFCVVGVDANQKVTASYALRSHFDDAGCGG